MKMTFKVTVIGGVIVFFAVVLAAVFIPAYVWDPPRTVIAHEYSSLEERGREVFYSNGCNYCHTQYVREEDTAMGPVSLGGNYAFDNPMILGSERTGPDLSYIGRKRSEAWEIRHWKDPRAMSPLSIMPSFEFLSDEDLNAMAAYLFALGDRVAAERMILPPEAYGNKSDTLPDPMTATGSDQPQGWPTWTAMGLQEGKEIYVANCLTCHGDAGNGLGSYAGTLIVTPADFKQDPFQNMPDEQWFWHVSEGIQGTVMPPWKESLTEDERWKVIRYVKNVFAQPVMHDPDEGDPSGTYANLTNPLDPTVENLDEGKAIFTRECMVCHGDAGRGSGPFRDYLQPGPPDFGDGSYGDYTDADYFWRISEGVPWSAMPAWKVEYNEEERWKLVYFIRTIFTQTQDRPPEPASNNTFIYPDFYKNEMRFPDDVSFESGKIVFLQNCAHCHGLALDGTGWDGQYLNPQPADFRSMAGMSMKPEAQGEHLAKVSFGIKDTAMPVWGEWLPFQQRWDAIQYLMGVAMMGKPVTSSDYGNGQVPARYVTVSSDVFVSEGHSISEDHGQELYTQYCVTCHGENGQGDGSGTQNNASKGPAPFAADMGEQYINWRIHEGVPDSFMYPFKWLLSEKEIWDITVYVNSFNSTQGGGQ
ncbi:MAG: c-type cytochrome [Anaerolineales bacterium]|jgi:mono/diheme cytochrome c family protein